MRNHISYLLVIIAALTLVTGCDGNSSNGDKEPAIVEEFSMGVDESDAGTYLTIKKSALGQEILLQASFIQQQSYGARIMNPMSTSMRSRIVIFQEEGDQLLMLNAMNDEKPGQELEATLLITSFPIIQKSEEVITFDFNEGMSNTIIAWDWYGSDSNGEVINPDMNFEIKNAFIREHEVHTSAITVKHNVLLEDEIYLLPFEFVYYFSPYTPNPNYVPVRSPGFEYLGYFENNPRVDAGSGLPYTHITKFDISQPVTYYISSDFPEEYRQAAIEGVLYWNKVFGQEVLRAEIAPENIKAPNFNHNVVQWVDSYLMGAYADDQSDPRTGEVLHSQIYFGSGYAKWDRYIRLPRRDRLWNADGDTQADSKSNTRSGPIVLRNSESNPNSIDVEDSLNDFYKYRDIVADLPEERIQSLTQDLIRAVVAHELGHALGLRHNFAASTASPWTAAEEEQIFQRYLNDGTLPDNIAAPHNSIMEYPGATNKILIGALIKDDRVGALAHDVYAIHWAYFAPEELPEYQGMPFCTDSGLGVYNDCTLFDAGKHAIDTLAFSMEKNFTKIPQLLAETYLSSKTHFIEQFRDPVEKATPSAADMAMITLTPFFEIVKYLTEDLSLLSVLMNYPDYSDIDDDKIAEDTMDWLNAEIAFAGNVQSIFKIADPTYYSQNVDALERQFAGAVSSKTYQEIELPEGGDGGFTSEEIAYMKERAKDLFPKLDQELAKNITYLLQMGVFKKIAQVEDVESAIAAWAHYVLTMGSDKAFRYEIETRRMAAALMSAQGPYFNWLDAFKAPVADQLKLKLESVFGKPLEEIDPRTFPRDDQERVMEELSIYHMISSGYMPLDGA